MFSALQLIAQPKEELEVKIDRSLFPQEAKEMTLNMFGKTKIHWIKETTNGKISYEAKCKKDGVRYSLEFDEQGKFEDLEFQQKVKRLSMESRNKIDEVLKTDFSTFKIEKIQQQWSGNKDLVLNSFLTNTPDSSLIVKYEIIVEGKENNHFNRYEYLFTMEGRLENRTQLSSSNHDNFFY